eukprot:6466809-Amphidinium_carterae.1
MGGKKGKGKAAPPTPEDVERQLRHDIQLALPIPAKRRAATRLLAEEWDAPTVPYDSINHLGGITYIPKSEVAAALARIGSTRQPTALVTSESPEALYMRGYPSEHLWLGLLVLEGSTERQVRARKHVIQVGFGEPVRQRALGDEIQLPAFSERLVFKLRSEAGGVIPLDGSELYRLLEQHTRAEFVENLVIRQGGDSITAMVAKHAVPVLLKASGRDGLFIKKQGDSDTMELLWLESQTSLATALHMSHSDPNALGVAAKQSAEGRRFAIRFQSAEHYKAAAS